MAGSGHGIPLDKAELLSALMEALLYGFSLLMFGGTIAILWSRRTTTHHINRRMLTVACSLLLFSTVHLAIDITRVMEGLILFRDTFPGGPIGYFSDVSQWTFVYKNYIYTAQTLIGDGVILYRCYAVWQSKLVMILPALLWCSVAVTGIGSPYTASHVVQQEVFGGSLSRWITSFYASTLTTNLFTTILLAYRIWRVERISARVCGYRKSQLRHILQIIIDAGAIYSITLLGALLCFVSRSNGQYVILDMVMPIISITFYMVIIRVGMAGRESQTTTLLPSLQCAAGGGTSFGVDPQHSMHLQIATLRGSKVTTEHGQSTSSTLPMTTVDYGESKGDGNQLRFDGCRGEEAV